MPARSCVVLILAALATGEARAQSAAQPADGDRAAVVVREARRLINAGEPKAAIEVLAKLNQPAGVDVAYILGIAYYRADDHQRAIAQLTPVISKLPADSIEHREAVQVLGLSLYITGRLAEALPHLEQTRRWAADNLELAYVLGLSYLQTQQPDRARESLAHTFAVPAGSAAAHVVTAQMAIRLQLEEAAELELKRALDKDRRVPQANYLLGQIALFRGRFDEAIALSQRELAVNPANAMALYQLGDAHIRQLQWDEGIGALQKSIWLNPFYSGPYILLGRAYMKKGQPETAEGMLRRAIQYDPNNRTAHYLLAQLLQQTGRVDEAKREFEIAERLQGQPGRQD